MTAAAMRPAFYNEWDPYAAQWLRNLAAASLIAPGHVDSRSIRNVRAVDLDGFDRVHFFAGIGGWDVALQIAGWPDEIPVWTGSCPCQPFSAAGKRGGFDDDRHLWPEFFRLISECRPGVVMGEQVASSDGLAWLDLVHADLESAGYTVWAADLCAAGVGAPHIRQRLWWVGLAHSLGPRLEGRDARPLGHEREAAERSGTAGGMADADRQHGHYGRPRSSDDGRESPRKAELPTGQLGLHPWSDIDWLPCRDGKARPTRPGLFPLAHGVSARVGKLRAVGNAIVPPVGAAFVRAVMDIIPSTPRNERVRPEIAR